MELLLEVLSVGFFYFRYFLGNRHFIAFKIFQKINFKKVVQLLPQLSEQKMFHQQKA